ncbi:MAG: hypothetical protein AAGF75_12915, partial [Cyanobacteria bacterium P01_H01_bin.130]
MGQSGRSLRSLFQSLGRRLQAVMIAISLATVSGPTLVRAEGGAPIELSQSPAIGGRCKRSPQALLDGILTDPQLKRSHWGILVQPLPTASDRETPLSAPWLSHNVDQF